MDSGQRVASAVDWANLPAELLGIIYANLKNSPAEKFRFRWVCRRWRLSAPPPPNKLSVWFPLRPSVLAFQSADRRYDSMISASAVYLVRSRSDPTKACLVSLHEASAGNLVLRHPLFGNRISDSSAADDVDWILATQTLISRSYAYTKICRICHQISDGLKAAFVLDSGSGSGFVCVCGYHRKEYIDQSGMALFAFSTDLSGRANPAATNHRIRNQFFPGDFVTFNGRIIAVDKRRRIYVLDHTSLKLIKLNSIPMPTWSHYALCTTQQYLVASDGDLYLVSLIFQVANACNTCQIYRLRVLNNQKNKQVSVEVEKVEDLGDDRVFCIGRTHSFSVSARDLPPLWKGNCIVYHNHDIICELMRLHFNS